MKSSKSTLADLRRLRAQQADPATAAIPKPEVAASTSRAGKRRTRATDSRPGPRHPDPAPTPVAPAIAPEDHALFEQAMRFVRPLPRIGTRAHGRTTQDPYGLLRERREHAQGEEMRREPAPPRSRRRPTAALDPDASEFLQSGCGTDLLRGLKRGKWRPEAILDLHGNTEEQAHERLDRFVVTCVEHDIRCVCIVHGKGIGSRQGAPVLKSAVRIHLCRLQAVQAWVQCAEPDGGAGAVTVLLRRPPETPSP